MAELMNSKEADDSKTKVLRLKVGDASETFKDEVAQQRLDSVVVVVTINVRLGPSFFSCDDLRHLA